MRRLQDGNPNTPEAFDTVWRLEMEAGRKQFDLYRFRAMMAGILPGAKVIELGCGCSEFLSFLLNHRQGVTATGLDYSAWAVAYMHQVDPRVAWQRGDALTTGYPDGAFDVVLAGELVEHLDRPQELIAEMARLCRPAGFIRITTPIEAIAARDAYHVWSLGEADLVELFRCSSLPSMKVENVGDYWVATGYRA